MNYRNYHIKIYYGFVKKIVFIPMKSQNRTLKQ